MRIDNFIHASSWGYPRSPYLHIAPARHERCDRPDWRRELTPRSPIVDYADWLDTWNRRRPDRWADACEATCADPCAAQDRCGCDDDWDTDGCNRAEGLSGCEGAPAPPRPILRSGALDPYAPVLGEWIAVRRLDVAVRVYRVYEYWRVGGALGRIIDVVA